MTTKQKQKIKFWRNVLWKAEHDLCGLLAEAGATLDNRAGGGREALEHIHNLTHEAALRLDEFIGEEV